MAERDDFRCKTCCHIVVVDITASPKEVLHCPKCEKILGRVDSVCAELADAAGTMASHMLRLTLEKMDDADEHLEQPK